MVQYILVVFLRLLIHVWSISGVVLKLLACKARGPWLDSRSPLYDFRDWLSPARIKVKYRKSDVNNQNNQTKNLIYVVNVIRR